MIYVGIATSLGTGRTAAQNINENQDIEEDRDLLPALHLQAIGTGICK